MKKLEKKKYPTTLLACEVTLRVLKQAKQTHWSCDIIGSSFYERLVFLFFPKKNQFIMDKYLDCFDTGESSPVSVLLSEAIRIEKGEAK